MDPGSPTLLDGGLSTALAARGVDLDHPLWTARLLLDDPEVLEAAHLDFLRAGAQVLITASYQLSRRGIVAVGHDAAIADELLHRATAVARAAAARHRAEASGAGDGAPALVAASVGPFGAVLADGSEYTGRYPVGPAELADFHAERLAVLVASGPDLLAVETLPGAAEAAAVVAAARRVPGPLPPSWVTFTCRDGAHTAAGDRIEDAVATAADLPGLALVGVNCTAPALVGELLARMAAVTDLPLVAYPNSGQVWDPDGNRWLGTPDTAFDVAGWAALGARWIGGCCGVGPDAVAALAGRVRAAPGAG